MKQRFSTTLLTAIPLLYLCLPSCINTEVKLNEQRVKVKDSYLNELRNQEQNVFHDSYKANWHKAQKDLFMRSPNIIRANFRIDDSIENRMQVWKDMIPSLSVNLSDSATIGEISDLFVDTNFRISSFFSFGNLIDLPKRVARLKLTQYGTELSAEQTMRNEVISLYRVFREQELLDLEAKALKWEKQFIQETVLDANSTEHLDALEKHSDKEEALEKKRKAWRKKLGDLMQSRLSSARLSSQGLPNILYKASDLNFKDSKRWGYLQMNLLALELLAEDANLTQAYARYLPTPSLSISAPPLFSSNSSQDFAFEDFRLSPSVSWQLDTRGSIGRQIRRIKREQPFRNWQRDQRLQREIEQLLEGREQLRETQKELAETRQIIKEYQQLVLQGYVEDLEEALQKMRNLKEKEITLRAQEVEICTSFWLIDEYRWKETTKLWKRSRLELEKKREVDRKAERKKKGWIPFLKKKEEDDL